jgi:hypothetical protein
MSGKMQDALCIAATGGGAATRTLFTNDEETVLKVKRPVIINSIPRVITAQDLTDRALCIELPTIEYREELEINALREIKINCLTPGCFSEFDVDTLDKFHKHKKVCFSVTDYTQQFNQKFLVSLNMTGKQ